MAKINILGISDLELVSKIKQEYEESIALDIPMGPITEKAWIAYSNLGFKFLSKNYSSLEENERSDIAIDAVDKFIKSVISGQYQVNPNAKSDTYYINLCRFKSLDLFKNKSRAKTDYTSDIIMMGEELSDDHPSWIEEMEDRATREYLEELLDEVKDNNFNKSDCRKVIDFKYKDLLTHQQIAEKMNFKNEQISKNKLKRCLGYLRKHLLSYTSNGESPFSDYFLKRK